MASKGENLYRWGERALARGEAEKALRYFAGAWQEGHERARVRAIITETYITPNALEREANYRSNAHMCGDLPAFEALAFDVCAVPGAFFVFDWDGGRVSEVTSANVGAVDGRFDLIAQEAADMLPILEAADGCSVHLVGAFAPAALTLTQTKAARIFWYRDADDAKARFPGNVTCALCFAIPSWNRGPYALRAVVSCLRGNYYAETGVYVSDNGSDQGAEAYAQIQALADPRARYHRFEENTGLHRNWCQVIGQSHGRYACLLSDEDVAVVGAIPHYLEKLRTNHQIGAGTSANQRRDYYYRRGHEALSYGLFEDNHVTGLIYNTLYFNLLRVADTVLGLMDGGNYFAQAYPHSCFTLFLSTVGDNFADSTPLAAMGFDFPHNASETYAAFEARGRQFIGFLDMLDGLRGRFQLSDETLRLMLDKYLRKVTFLLTFNYTHPNTARFYHGMSVAQLREQMLALYEKELTRRGISIDLAPYGPLVGELVDMLKPPQEEAEPTAAPSPAEREANYRANAALCAGLPAFETLPADVAEEVANAHRADTNGIDGRFDLIAQAPGDMLPVLAAADGCTVHLVGASALTALTLTRTKAARIFWYRDAADAKARFPGNTDCVLCFAIPSWNRGSYAIRAVRSCLTDNVYAETAVYLSDNGSDQDTEGYGQIRAMADPRLRVHRFPQNMGLQRNFCQVVGASPGRFACLLSDEDLALPGGVPYYLEKLKAQGGIGMGCSLCIGVPGSEQMKAAFYERGHAALSNGILQDNYITGLIYNTALFKELNVEEEALGFLARGNQAVSYYIHSFFTVMLLARGDYFNDRAALTWYVNDFPHAEGSHAYGSFEARRAYFNGFAEVFGWLAERFALPQDTLLAMVRSLCGKLVHLLALNYLEPSTRDFYEGVSVAQLSADMAAMFEEGLAKLGVTVNKAAYGDALTKIIAQYAKEYE